MELDEALRSTGSARSFTTDPVSDTTVAEVLDSARFAPNGGNRQPWRVVVVKDIDTRRRMATMMRTVWEDYAAAKAAGVDPFVLGHGIDAPPVAAPNPLLDHIDDVPVVLAVAVDLRRVALMDGLLGTRPPVVGGASIYPFCWSILLAARARGLGGVMTTFLSRAEHEAGPLLGLPPDHALAATIFLGVPEHQPTRLRRRPVDEFTTVDRFDGPAFTA